MSEENRVELSGIFTNGYGIIPKKLMQEKSLSVYDKCILAYMLSFTGGGNSCFPSYKKIAEDLGISAPTISKSLKKLSQNGYIRTEKLYPDDKLKRNNKYILTFLSKFPILNEIKSRSKPSKQSKLKRLSSNNNNINNNNNEKDKDLFNSLKDHLLSKYSNYHNDNIESFPKEMSSIKSIIKKSGGDKVLIYNKLKIFEEKFNNPDNKFWAEISFLPSMILATWLSLNPSRKIIKKEEYDDEDPFPELEDFTNYKNKKEA